MIPKDKIHNCKKCGHFSLGANFCIECFKQEARKTIKSRASKLPDEVVEKMIEEKLREKVGQ